jgi:hypothetical protein
MSRGILFNRLNCRRRQAVLKPEEEGEFMAKGVRRLDGAKVRLLLAATLCAGFFIASTGVEEWCNECYPHAGNELTIVNHWNEQAKDSAGPWNGR